MMSLSIIDNTDNVKAIRIAFFNTISLIVLFTTIFLLYTIYNVLEPFFGALAWSTLFGVFLFPAKFYVSNLFIETLSHPKYKTHSLIFDILLAPILIIGWIFDQIVSTLKHHCTTILFLSLIASLLTSNIVVDINNTLTIDKLLNKDYWMLLLRSLFDSKINNVDLLFTLIIMIPTLYCVLVYHLAIPKHYRQLLSFAILLFNDLFWYRNSYVLLVVVGFVIFEEYHKTCEVSVVVGARSTPKFIHSRNSSFISPTKFLSLPKPASLAQKHNLEDSSPQPKLTRNHSFGNFGRRYSIDHSVISSTIYEDTKIQYGYNYKTTKPVDDKIDRRVSTKSRTIDSDNNIRPCSTPYPRFSQIHNNYMAEQPMKSNFTKKFSLLLDNHQITQGISSFSISTFNIHNIFSYLTALFVVTLFYKYNWLCPMLWSIFVAKCILKIMFNVFPISVSLSYQIPSDLIYNKLKLLLHKVCYNRKKNHIHCIESNLHQFLYKQIHWVSSILIIFGFFFLSYCVFFIGILKIRLEINKLIQIISYSANTYQPHDVVLKLINMYAPEYINITRSAIKSNQTLNDINAFTLENSNEILKKYIGVDRMDIFNLYTNYTSTTTNKAVHSYPNITDIWNITNILRFYTNITRTFNIKDLEIELLNKISPFFSIFTYLFYNIVVSGHIIFRYIINIAIFLTSLYLLLTTSRYQYSPIQLINDYSGVLHLGNTIGCSINDIFGAAFKMMLFYGVYFWCSHTLFNINLVYIPTVLAIALAVLPFANITLAVLPGIIDLYFIQGRSTMIILMFYMVHFIPPYIVDPIIYGEITSGGHPYLTALMICGGIYYYGVVGTIIGPILLCSLMVIYRWGQILSEAISFTIYNSIDS